MFELVDIARKKRESDKVVTRQTKTSEVEGDIEGCKVKNSTRTDQTETDDNFELEKGG